MTDGLSLAVAAKPVVTGLGGAFMIWLAEQPERPEPAGPAEGPAPAGC